jgi:hypothetical protein
MLSHKAVLGSLDAYADGSLPGSERTAVAAHLATCAECRESLRQIHRLDLVMNDLPPMQAVPFGRFWSKLERRLPGHPKKRAPFFQPERLAAGFALAVLASLVGVVALASDETMPDSPLYAVKHLRQDVQRTLADPRERGHLDLTLAKQRLKEALVMLQRQRDDLALVSLGDMKHLVVEAKTLVKNSDSKADAAELKTTISEIKTDLTAASGANHEPDSSTPAEITAVDGALEDVQDAVTQVETVVEATAPAVESPSPSPVVEQPTPAASPTAEPSVPAAAPSAAPSEAPSPEQAAPAPAGPSDAAAAEAATTPAP